MNTTNPANSNYRGARKALTGVLVATLVWVLILSFNYRLDEFNNDVAHYTSTARFLLAGDGIKTDVLYYELQHELGMPAPQTVWPPGYPAAIAAVAALGVDLPVSAYVVTVASYAAAAILLFLLVVRTCKSPGWGIAAAGVWLMLAAGASSVLAADSEILFTALSLGSALAMTSAFESDKRQYSYLLLAGTLAAMACSVRFIGIALVPALAATPFLMSFRQQPLKGVISATVAAAVPTLALGGLFFRNYQIVGSITGGPRVHGNSTIADIVRHFWWSLKSLLGVPTTTLVTIAVFALLAAATVIFCVGLGQAFRRHGLGRNLLQASPTTIPLAIFAVIYSSASIAVVVRLALEGTAGYIQPRYLVPLVPFLLILLASATTPLSRNVRPAALIVAGTLGGLGYLAGQANGFSLIAERSTGGARTELLEALDRPIATSNVREALFSLSADGGAILSNNAQFLGMVIERPTVGLPQALYSHKTWSTDEVENLVAQLRVSAVALFGDDINHENAPFFDELARGSTPTWLETYAVAEGVKIYAVKPSAPPRLD